MTLESSGEKQVLISNRTKKPIVNRQKKGKKFVTKVSLMQLVEQINSQRDSFIKTKQETEMAKRQGMLELTMKHEAAKRSKHSKKETRIKELKEQLAKKKNKVEKLESKLSKPRKKSGKPIDSGKKKKVSFAL
jgi:hypothetical protein